MAFGPLLNTMSNFMMGLASGAPLSGLFSPSAGIPGLGGGGLVSDEDLKKMLEKGGDDIKSFLDAIDSYEYEYKNKDHGKGKKYGIMAQDLEKSKVGKTIVRETDEGKMIDALQSVGPTLAALGYIHKRLKKLEGKK